MTDADKIEMIGGVAFAALLFVMACVAYGVFDIIRVAVGV